MNTGVSKTANSRRVVRFKEHVLAAGVILLIIVAAIVRSSIATSLDSFAFDEGYHNIASLRNPGIE